MPYPGMDDSLIPKMDACVEKVMAEGKDKGAAIAICRAAIEKETKATDVAQELEALNDFSAKAAPPKPGDYLIVEDPEKVTTYHLQVKTDGKPDHRLMGAAWAALHGGYRGNKYEGPGKQEAIAKLRKMYEAENLSVPGESKETKEQNPIMQLIGLFTDFVREKAGARNSANDLERLQKAHDLLVENGAQCTLKVFKGEDGRLRWVTFSSTAYQDRDGEFVSTKALQEDVARADATKEYGPLRWWHMPGVDLGDCDFNMLAGRVLLESGTFRTEPIGASIKEAADELGVSIGFHHPAGEPDAGGVFHTVRRFERSLLPAGKASNLFTSLTVKEEGMDIIQQKKDELEKLVGKEQAAQLLAGAEKVEKEADAAGVAFKDTALKLSQSAGDREREIAAFARVDEEGGRETEKQFQESVYKCMKDHMDALGALQKWQGEHEKAHASKKEADEAKAQAAQIAALDAALKQAREQIAELQGETPRSAKGFRASQEGPVRAEPEGPQPNQAFKQFLDFAATGKTS